MNKFQFHKIWDKVMANVDLPKRTEPLSEMEKTLAAYGRGENWAVEKFKDARRRLDREQAREERIEKLHKMEDTSLIDK